MSRPYTHTYAHTYTPTSSLYTHAVTPVTHPVNRRVTRSVSGRTAPPSSKYHAIADGAAQTSRAQMGATQVTPTRSNFSILSLPPTLVKPVSRAPATHRLTDTTYTSNTLTPSTYTSSPFSTESEVIAPATPVAGLVGRLERTNKYVDLNAVPSVMPPPIPAADDVCTPMTGPPLAEPSPLAPQPTLLTAPLVQELTQDQYYDVLKEAIEINDMDSITYVFGQGFDDWTYAIDVAEEVGDYNLVSFFEDMQQNQAVTEGLVQRPFTDNLENDPTDLDKRPRFGAYRY